ncbi:MAG: glycoside hydrolase family 24 [Bradyrhizobium sp.]|nr:glycoside hydrolase family 24 [Bradyrhizobium sp.]
MSVKKSVATAASAGVIACCVAFTPTWEGMDKVARYDKVGTGHPLTWCYGFTPVDDKTVKPGQKFTKQECDKGFAAKLQRYLDQIDPCIHVALPTKTVASLVDAAWNAGPPRVCKSPMLARMNAGNIKDGCDAFNGWIVRGNGNVLPGLIDRRAGELYGDKRKSERALCLEGLSDPKSEWYLHDATRLASAAPAAAAAPPAKCPWWRKCT